MSDIRTETENPKKIETQIQGDLDIDETKLAEELQRQPARFFYYAVSWALAQRKSRITQLRLKELEARTSASYRKEMVDTGMKPRDVTIKMVEDYCTEHVDVQALRDEWIQAEYIMDMLDIAKIAFRQRSQSLIELFKSKGEEQFYENHGMEAMTREVDKKRGRKAPKDTD